MAPASMAAPSWRCCWSCSTGRCAGRHPHRPIGSIDADLQDIVHSLKERDVALKATEQPIDTSSAAGKAFLDMPGVFAAAPDLLETSSYDIVVSLLVETCRQTVSRLH